MSTRLSVVVPHYGDPDPTLEVIAALRAQDFPQESLQVIVSDDCSPTPFPSAEGAQVVRRAVNGGFGSAVNTGAAAARGDWLMILNSDVTMGPDFLSRLLAAAEAWGRPGVFGPRVIEGGVAKVTSRRWPTVTGLMAEWLEPLAGLHSRGWYRRLNRADLPADGAFGAHPTDWLVGVCLLMPRVEFEAVGGFDETFFMNCEEIDLQRRLADHGCGAVFVPTVSLAHVGGGSSDPGRRLGWVTDARFHYHWKWGGDVALVVGLTAATVVNLVWNAARRAAGRPVEPMPTFRQELAVIRHGWHARRRKAGTA